MSANLFRGLCVVLLLSLTFSAPAPPAPAPSVPLGQLVPQINTTYYTLEPSDNKYVLTITNPNGGQRFETVTLEEDGTPKVSGSYSVNYPNHPLVIVSYEAGKNGYVAKVQYVHFFSLSPGALKSAAG